MTGITPDLRHGVTGAKNPTLDICDVSNELSQHRQSDRYQRVR
ncbi:MAG: hypothetical protein A07HR60_01705 [uncultured archaeon A07HR60]|nr:MAG: hypothetical protein A07HR60_01705 [uncultured archaeon A07HR60]